MIYNSAFLFLRFLGIQQSYVHKSLIQKPWIVNVSKLFHVLVGPEKTVNDKEASINIFTIYNCSTTIVTPELEKPISAMRLASAK